jgi:signal transduction histidine kinase/ActR/RegA family two-component response regulator
VSYSHENDRYSRARTSGLLGLLIVSSFASSILLLYAFRSAIRGIEQRRTASLAEQAKATRMMSALNSAVVDGRHVAARLLDGSTTFSETRQWPANLTELVERAAKLPWDRLDTSTRATLDRSVRSAIEAADDLWRRGVAWEAADEDSRSRLEQQRTEVERCLDQMIGGVETKLGNVKLARALSVLERRSAAGAPPPEAIGRAIDTAQADGAATSASRELNEIECSLYRLLAAVDEQGVVQVRDNDLMSALLRLHEAVDVADGQAAHDCGVTPEALTAFQTALFGVRHRLDSAHQTVELGTDGLVKACIDAHRHELEHHKLRAEIPALFGEFDAVGSALVKVERALDGDDETTLQAALESTWTTISWLSLSTAFVLLALSLFIGAGIRRQFTRMEHINRQIDSASKQSRAASRAKSEFLATMSHEIRTPLNGMIGMANLLADTPLTREQSEYASAARESGQLLLRIVNDILDFSKIEVGKLAFEKIEFAPRQVFADTATLFALQARSKGLEFASKIDPAVPDFALGDPSRLRQVLTNLLGNALKFTVQGSITLDVHLDGTPESALFLRCDIIDTGVGIPPAARARLFQPFSQADGSMARRFGGTGLGLAISKQLVEIAGGDLWVESEEGRGSRFAFTWRIELPRAGASAAPLPAVTAPTSAVPGRKLCVLLVEDNAINQRVALAHLKRLGCTVSLASDGAQGLEQAFATDFDLVLMDCQMPNMDGFEATRHIRAFEGRRAFVPIVAMTANAMQGDRERCLAAGMDDYIAKPFSATDLARVVAKWAGARGERPAA